MFHLYRKLKWAYQKFKVSYSLPFIVLVSYTLLGAVIFRKIELLGDVERREMYKNSTEYAFDQVMKRLKNVSCEKSGLKVDPELQEKYAKEALFWFIDYLNLTQVIEDRTAATPWTWMGSALYAGQLYTTIGYGYPLVNTNLGKVISILYIMIGIPIFLIILKDVGKLLSRALRKIYKRWRTAKNKIPDNAAVRRMSEPVKAIYSLTGGGNEKSLSPKSSENHSLASPTKTISTAKDLEIQFYKDIEQQQQEEQEQQEQEIKNKNSSGHFPIPLALTLLVVWILLSAALFCVWETEWGYLTSVYFFFVSISTVGLGDIVPTKPDMMLINFVLILVGLALLSMCITLIQDAVERIIEQLLQEYIEEIEKMAAIVTSDNEFVEESATPFEVGMSADLLTAPLTAFSKEQESWYTSFPQKAKDWMAEKLVDKFLIKQLDSHSDSDDSEDENEDDELEAVKVEDGRFATPDRLSSQKDAISKALKRKKRRLNRGFILNYNIPTLRTIQAMEKVKIKTQNNSTFRGRLFAKFAANKKFNKYLDDHIVEPPISNAAMVGAGNPQKKSSEGSPNSWRCRLVTPESVVGSTKSSIATASTAFDQDSLYSAAYHDVIFGYSTESVPRLIEKERKQLEQEEKLEKLKQRRASKDSIPPMIIIPKDMVVIAPPLAELDETAPIKIKVNRSSDSPEPIEIKMPDSYALDPHQSSLIDRRRRASTPFLGLNAPPNLDPITRMPMMRCPSCLHLSTAPSAIPDHHSHSHSHHLHSASECNSPDENAKVFKRVQSLCGLLPSDFTPVQSPIHSLSQQHQSQQHQSHQQHQPRSTLSPSPSRGEDSGYGNTIMTDSLMTDSALTGSSLMPTIYIKPHNNINIDNEDEDERIGNGKIFDTNKK